MKPTRPREPRPDGAADSSGPPTTEEFLQTQHVEKDLAGHATRSVTYMIASQGIQFALALAAIMVLARLLTPADFGIVAMAGAWTGLVNMIKEFGLTTAAVQKATLSQAELSRLFWLNLQLSLALTLFTLAMAPVLAWFFGEPDLLSIVVTLAAGMFVSTLSNVHLGVLRRRMRFRVLSTIEVAAQFVGTTTAIVTAFLGASFWALVAQQLLVMLIRGLAILLVCRWRPDRPGKSRQDDVGFRSLRSFARSITLSNLLFYLSSQLYRLLIGRFAGAAALGLYNNAFRWAHMASWQLQLSLQNVIVSVFSRLQDNPRRYRAYFRTATAAIWFLIIPTTTFLFIDGREVILVLMGDQWLSAVPIFKILVLASLATNSSQIASGIYLAEGRARRALHWGLISTPIVMAGVIIGLAWGTVGVAAGYAAAHWLLFFPKLRFCVAASPLRVRDILAPAVTPAVAALLAGLIVWGVRLYFLPQGSPFTRVVIHAGIFSAAYLGFSLLRPSGLKDLSSLMKILFDAKGLSGPIPDR
jgi:O-antigen/teichoic acid export membrane protein